MPEVTLSKNQQKRLLRAQRRKETKAEWRMKVALKRKQRKALKDLVEKNCAENETDELKEKSETAEQIEKLTEEENELRKETNDMVKESTDSSAQLLDKKSKRSKPIKEQLSPKHHIIIDSSFDSLMNEREIASLASQITRCYASNRRVQQPFHLTVTSFSDALQTAFKESHPDFEKFQVDFTKESYDLLHPKENLIYLTADADEVVDELEDGKCYIIGGLVDRNRHKGVTALKATEQGIRQMKLPISGNIRLLTSQALTCNHVFEILLQKLNGKSWKDAIVDVIPKRKAHQ